ncbi:rhodanese-like domain-containing protein [Chloroflexota bacterium]
MTGTGSIAAHAGAAAVSTAQLSRQLGQPGWVIVDVRGTAAYNGWRLEGEVRGGHIPGALSFPISWTRDVPKVDLLPLLQSKGITADKTIVVYAGQGDQSSAMARPLRHLGYPRVRTYEGGHIPGAVYLDAGVLEETSSGNLVPDQDLEGALLAHGMRCDTMVVLYGRDTLPAAQVAAILMVAGVEDVRLSAGCEIETQTRAPAAASAFGSVVPAHPEYIIDIKGARAILTDDHAELVSIRSWAEYTGQTSGYDYIVPRGRIAGAVWGHGGIGPSGMEDFRNVDSTMRSYHEIAANWRAWGITPDKRVAFSCGTGWRASEAFFYAHLMGWERISVYDGGWHEWSADPLNPVQSGEPARAGQG